MEEDDFELSREQFHLIMMKIQQLETANGQKDEELARLRDNNQAMQGAANIINTPVGGFEKLKLQVPAAFEGSAGGLKGHLAQVRAYQ